MFYIFALLLSIYLLTAAGIQHSDVGGLRHEVARSIVDRFDVDVPCGRGVVGVDGREYSWFGIGSILLTLPMYIIGKVFEIQPDNLLLLFNPTFGAATVSLLFLFAASLGYSRRSSVIVSILYGLGTMAWYYAKDPGDHIVETFFILLSFFGTYRFLVSGKMHFMLIAGAALGIAFLTRSNSILVMVPLLLMFAANFRNTRDVVKTAGFTVRGAVCFFSALLPSVLILLWYNDYRFGTPFETGYSLIAGSLGMDFFTGTSLVTGLVGLLASPGKGYFYYSPIAVLFFFSIRSFWKKHPIVAVGFVSMIVIYILFYAKYLYWHGDWAWGPRFIFVATPFFMIPIAEMIDTQNWYESRYLRKVVYSLLICGMLIQLLAVSFSVRSYFFYLQDVKKISLVVDGGAGVQPIIEPPPETYFDWSLSPILVRAEIVYSILSGMIHEENPSVRGSEIDMPDIWWIYRYYTDKSIAGLFVVPLLALYIILAALRLNAISKNS